MRVALYSDIHGNRHALEAVLAEAAAAHVDEHWILGDLVAHGPEPATTLKLLMDLPNARFVRGNTDRYVLTGQLPSMAPLSEAGQSPSGVHLRVDVATSFAWTRGAITAIGGYEWLAARPTEERRTLPDGTWVLLVHAAPGRDDGPGLEPDLTDRELLDRGLSDADADLVLVGHTHIPMDRVVGSVRVVNLGSVSVPMTAERRAMWTLLEANRRGYRLEPRFAPYNLSAVIAELKAVHHPSAEWLTAKFHRFDTDLAQGQTRGAG